MSYVLQPDNINKKGYGAASFIVSLIPLIFFPFLILMPLATLVLGILAVILGATSLDSTRKGLAMAGLILGIVELIYGLTLSLGF